MQFLRTLIALVLASTHAAQSLEKVAETLDVPSPVGQTWQGAALYDERSNTFVISWESTGRLLIRRVALDGTFSGPTAPLRSGARPRMAYDPVADRVLLAYLDGTGVEARGLLLNGGDLFVQADFGISGGYHEPYVLYNAVDQEFLHYGLDAQSSSIVFQRVDPDAQLVGAPFAIGPNPNLAPTGAGAFNATRNEYLVTYRRQFPSFLQRAQRLDASLSPLGGGFAIGEGVNGASRSSAVAYDSRRDRFLIAISTPGNGYGQFLDSDGSFLGASFPLPTPSGTQIGNLDLVYMARHDLFVLAHDTPGASPPRIVGTLLDPDGASRPPFAITSSTGVGQPAIAVHGDRNRLLFTWVEGPGLKAQFLRIAPKGSVRSTSRAPLPTGG